MSNRTLHGTVSTLSYSLLWDFKPWWFLIHVLYKDLQYQAHTAFESNKTEVRLVELISFFKRHSIL